MTDDTLHLLAAGWTRHEARGLVVWRDPQHPRIHLTEQAAARVQRVRSSEQRVSA